MPTVTARRLEGSVALVTGAAHGIGRACAVRLAAEGAQLALADLDVGAARQLLGELETVAPGPHLALLVDVTQQASVEEMVATAVDHLGGIDVLVNVAGGDVAHGAFDETGDDVWAAMVELNLLSVVRCCRAALPHLRLSSRGPAIVTVTSVNGVTTLGSEPYSAAKAGVSSLTANLAASLGPQGIRVNAVAPATVRTRVWDHQDGGADRLRTLYPLGRVGEPEDVAAAVAFLASQDAGWITGHTLPVDGGLLVRLPRGALP